MLAGASLAFSGDATKRSNSQSVAAAAQAAGVSHDTGDVMNLGGIPYQISNPPGSTADWVGTPGVYSTNFNENAGQVDHFDVYGEVQTRYSQVYWTRNAPIELPKEIVQRFAGKVMAITGYEVDQVVHDGPRVTARRGDPGPLSGFACYPECENGTDTSIPMYNAYNHHYFGWLMGKDAEVYERNEEVFVPNPTKTGVRALPNDHGFPTNIVFKENPGGEYRKSYHGYPKGYAQLLHSPSTFVVEPMQIDTHNRAFGLTERAGYQPSFLPAVQRTGVTQHAGGLSPLIECPCSSRVARTVTHDSKLRLDGTCQPPIASAAACAAAVGRLAPVSASTAVHDPSKPAGCVMVPDPPPARTYAAQFNSAVSEASCAPAGEPAAARALAGEAALGNETRLRLEHDGTTATITLSGPADGRWFGVGLGAKEMADRPYALIVDGSGALSERRLEEHGPGTLLPPSASLVSSRAADGVRTVVLRRAVAAQHDGAVPALPTAAGELDVITALGATAQLAYHRARTSARLPLVPSRVPACVCAPVATTRLSYMNQSAIDVGYQCADEPRSDMLRHGDGTGRAVPNAACAAATYHGGLQCCKHSWFLTDAQDDARVPAAIDTYYLKWRFYFQPFVAAAPAAAAAPAVAASHRHLHHWVFLIDERVNDYEEDNAHYGAASIGKISASLNGSTMGLEDFANMSTVGMQFLVITPHCHAPSCIREELWNADTGEILCNVTARYGRDTYGSTDAPFNEEGYVALPPCIFGHQPGLQRPWTLNASTRLVAHKYFNNTFRHLGQMAQWTGLMTYATDPF